jgi:L-ascorbate metabolism protein UlaG (beta-lactamase superfamily)
MSLVSVLVSLLLLVPQATTEKTSQGDLKITPITHGSLMFEFGGKTIHVDSWTGTGADLTKYPKADWMFITDMHPDHFDQKAIDIVKKGTTKFVAPAVVADKIPGATVMKNGETKDFDGIKVEAIPMYNLVRGPNPGTLFHDKGRGNGYIFTFGDKRVLVAGDTECTPELKALKNIDIAFLPMNLPYTMPPEEAAACAQAFKPKVLYAYHYGNSNVSGVAGIVGKDVQVRTAPK